MPTTATMMFGGVETHDEIVQHLIRVRDLQDEILQPLGGADRAHFLELARRVVRP